MCHNTQNYGKGFNFDNAINGINEAGLNAKDKDISIYASDEPIVFDIAATTVSTTDSKKEAGLKKKIACWHLKKGRKNSVVCRIKFSVDIPVDNREKINPVVGRQQNPYN